MCVPSILPTTLRKVDFSLRTLYFFPHLSGAGWKFNKLVFKVTECLNKVLAYSNSSRLRNSKHKTTRTITSLVANLHKPIAILVSTDVAARSIVSCRWITGATAVQIKWNFSLNRKVFFPPHVQSI